MANFHLSLPNVLPLLALLLTSPPHAHASDFVNTATTELKHIHEADTSQLKIANALDATTIDPAVAARLHAAELSVAASSANNANSLALQQQQLTGSSSSDSIWTRLFGSKSSSPPQQQSTGSNAVSTSSLDVQHQSGGNDVKDSSSGFLGSMGSGAKKSSGSSSGGGVEDEAAKAKAKLATMDAYQQPPPCDGFPKVPWEKAKTTDYMKGPFLDYEKQYDAPPLLPLRGMFSVCDCEAQTPRPRNMDFYSYYSEYFYRLRACRSGMCQSCFHLLQNLDLEQPGAWKSGALTCEDATSIPSELNPEGASDKNCASFKQAQPCNSLAVSVCPESCGVVTGQCNLMKIQVEKLATAVATSLKDELLHSTSRVKAHEMKQPNAAESQATNMICRDMGCC